MKISGGGDAVPVFEVDARFGLAPDETEPTASIVRAEGNAKLVVGPPTQAAGAIFHLPSRAPSRRAERRCGSIRRAWTSIPAASPFAWKAPAGSICTSGARPFR